MDIYLVRSRIRRTSKKNMRLQSALDYITVNQLGRTDVWIASDLRQPDWNPSSGRWEALRAAFAKLEAVRFHGGSIVDSQCNGDLKM